MATSKIEWTNTTWNPLTGCSKISPGCKNCYADRMSKRLQAMGVEKYRNAFRLTTHISSLDEPYAWKKPRMVFVNSMSDLFHKDVKLSFIKKVFSVMNENPMHQFQVLTKRSERLLEVSSELKWTKNIWMGVSVENRDYKYRIKHLQKVPAKVRFLSVEPFLGPLGRTNLRGIHWVIVGGESGPRARGMDAAWVREVRDQCIEKDIPFFFKQWGGVQKKKTGRTLDRRTWNEFPL